MALITVMGVSMAKPNGCLAAVAALELDVVRSMDHTVGDTAAYCFRHAFGTEQVFLVKVRIIYDALRAVFSAHEVRFLALEALLIR